jgi:archaemetzincin
MHVDGERPGQGVVEATMRAILAVAILASGCRAPSPEPGEETRPFRPDEAARTAHGGAQTVAAGPGAPAADFPLRVYEPPFPGDHEYSGVTWNEIFAEPGESFEAYISGYGWGTALRSIRLYPLGKPSKRLRAALDLARDYLAIAFSSEVTVMDPLDPPSGAYNSHFGQYDANTVLNGMMYHDDIDRASHLNLAVTETDMFAGRLNFVFGYADYVSHVGIVSLSRLGGRRDQALFDRRLLKLVRHEIGHMYGMAHCTNPACVMRGANSRAEADSTPLSLCPACAAKLAYRLGDDGEARNAALDAFYRARFAAFLATRLKPPVVRGD